MHITMVAAWEIARQKFPASSNGVGSRASSDNRRSRIPGCRLGVTFNANLLADRQPWGTRSEPDAEVFHQRQDPDDDDDDAHDLLGASVDRQHVDEIENENDDQEGNENADENGHDRPFCRGGPGAISSSGNATSPGCTPDNEQ